MNFVYTILLFLSTQLFYSQKSDIKLIVETKSKVYSVDSVRICEYNSGFEVHIDKKFRLKIFDKKTKNIYLTFGAEKLKIGLYNVLYSPKANVQNQTPLTPEGNIVIFKNETSFYFIIRTDDKSILLNFIGNKIEICN